MGEPPEPQGFQVAARGRDGGARELRAGWAAALWWGLAAAATGAILAEGLAFLALLASGGGGPSIGLVARLGDALFLWFHHAGIVFETTRTARGSPAPGSALAFSFTLSLAVLGGTALAAWMLARGGGAVARAATMS